MDFIVNNLTKSENVCDDNCEPSKPIGEAPMDKKELFDALDMLNYNEEGIDLAVLYYRMFPSDYSISKDGLACDGLENRSLLVCLDDQKSYPLDADGLLKNENNPDEWKDKHSKFKKKKKEQIWEKMLEIAELNSDINDLSVDNATTYCEILDEECEVAKLKEEIWNLYSDEHMEGEHINQSDQHANGLHLDERLKPTCINEQHNHNCQQFYGNLNNCTIVCSSVSPSGVNAPKKKKQQKKGAIKNLLVSDAKTTPTDTIETRLETGLPLPRSINTKRAQTYFQKAIDNGLLRLESGRFSWIQIGERGAKAQLAYFCGKVFEYEHSISGNVGTSFPEEELNELFGVKKMQSSLQQVHEAKNKQQWRRRIDELFE